MKKVFKNPVATFILGALIFSSISVYAAHKYAASNITYKDTTLDQALNTLYQTQNTTVNNLNSQISNKDATISELQTQVESLTAAASEKDYVTGTFTFPKSGNKDCNLGFRPSKLILYYMGSWGSVFIYDGNGMRWCSAIGSEGWYSTNYPHLKLTQNGFKIEDVETVWDESGKTYNYVAFK